LNNQLIAPIEQILIRSEGASWTEYQVICQLIELNVIDKAYAQDSLGLFQIHFLVMNALYVLQQSFLKSSGQFLSVSPLLIHLSDSSNTSPLDDVVSSVLMNSDRELREYYLNLEHFQGASTESVNDLLDSFWRKYLAQDTKQQYLSVMGLQEPVTLIEIKSKYRKMAMDLHPDRGGDGESLAKLNDAMEQLKKCYR
jgi:hypothetical protein